MRRDVPGAVLALLVFLFARSAAAQGPPLQFVTDPHLGTEGGIRTFDSLGRILFRYDEALGVLVPFDTRLPLGRAGAIAGRVAQLAFIDFAIASFESVLIHEVYGHGSRARDLRQPARFDFALPGLYCAILADSDNCTSHAQVTTGGGGRDRATLIDQGGIEANHLTGYFIDLRVMQSGGRMHEGDLLVYGVSKLAYVDTFLTSKLQRAGTVADGNDVAAYVTDLQDRFDRPSASDRVSVARQLRTAYLWNLADPLLWYSVYAGAYHGIYRGERTTTLPLPHVLGHDVLLTPRFGLTPFGAEHYVDLFAARGRSVFAVYGRGGSSGLASYTGAGVRMAGVRVHDRLVLGADADVWSQPELLPDDRAVYRAPQRRGASVGTNIDVRVYETIGISGRLAVKSSGFLAGQPIGSGVYGFFGVNVDLDGGAR